jgi:DNA polymerase-1
LNFARLPANGGNVVHKSTVALKAIDKDSATAHIRAMPAPAKSKTAKPAKASPAKSVAVSPAERPVKKGDHVFLVDGSGYIFRAYHAIRFEPRTPDGTHVNAVYGFCNMLWKLIKEMKPDERPTHLAVVFDKSEKTFRTEMYKEYKAHRPPPPDDLIPQFPLIRDAVRAFEIPCLEQAGYEADDLIATYARMACEAGATVTVVSSDKDLMQLVNDCVIMYDTMKDARIGIPEVIEKFGVPPDKVIEVQALIGDTSDNVPGVPGIGVKTAAQLIGEYGDLETLLKRASEIKQDKRRQALIDNAEAARMSKKLVTLDDRVPLDVPIESLGVQEPDYKALIAFLKSMGFKTLIQRVAEKSGVDAAQVEPGGADSAPSAKPGAPPVPSSRTAGQGQLPLDVTTPRKTPGPSTPALTPISLAERRLASLRQVKLDATKYETIETLDRLQHWIARAHETGVLALKTETSNLDPMQTALCGLAIAVAPNEAAYLPLGHRDASEDETSGLFAAKLCAGQIPERQALDALKPVLEDECIVKVGHDIKRDWLVLACRGVRLGATDDTMLMSYVMDAGKGAHDVDSVVTRYFGRSPARFNDVKNKDKALFTPEATPIARAAAYAAEDADVILRLWQALKPRMAAGQGRQRLRDTRTPLCRRFLPRWKSAASLSIPASCHCSPMSSARSRWRWSRRSTRSPERRSIPAARNSSATFFSDRWVCRAARRPRPVSGRRARERSRSSPSRDISFRKVILDWRQVSKLRSTYTEALPQYVNPRTHRVHTSYALASTSTGRLSSSEPNLQNIPIRTEDGRKIRRAFVAAPGMKLVSADYSQIELRLLSEVAQRADASQGLSGRRRHSRHDRVGNVRRAGQGHAG